MKTFLAIGSSQWLLGMFVGIGLLGTIGCSNSPSRTTEEQQGQPRVSYAEEAEGKAISNAAAQEAKAHDFVEIIFKPGSSELTEGSKSALNKLVSQANNSGKIDEILVMSWSDDEYPATNIKKLPKMNRDLAERRNKTIEDYIKSIKKVDVDLYNMAEHPNAFAKWFNTKDSRLKKTFLAAGLPTTSDNPQYPSKASHSLILVKLE